MSGLSSVLFLEKFGLKGEVYKECPSEEKFHCYFIYKSLALFLQWIDLILEALLSDSRVLSL